MTLLGIASAVCSGSIFGLLVSGLAPSFSFVFGCGVAAGVAAIVLLARDAFAPEEDTEPEVRPPHLRTQSRVRRPFSLEQDEN